MTDISATGNGFLGKYYFGGIIAVIAVLNLDLVVLNNATVLMVEHLIPAAILLVAIITISEIYFWKVLERYYRFSVSHRKLKYKYELTLHALMTDAPQPSFSKMLEEKVEKKPVDGFVNKFPTGEDAQSDFDAVSHYLLNHHRRSLANQEGDSYRAMARSLVILAIIARLIGLVLLTTPG